MQSSARVVSEANQRSRLAFFTKLVPDYVTTQLVNNSGSSDGAYGFSGFEVFNAAVGFFDISGFSALADKLDRDEYTKGYGSPSTNSRELGSSPGQLQSRRSSSKNVVSVSGREAREKRREGREARENESEGREETDFCTSLRPCTQLATGSTDQTLESPKSRNSNELMGAGLTRTDTSSSAQFKATTLTPTKL